MRVIYVSLLIAISFRLGMLHEERWEKDINTIHGSGGGISNGPVTIAHGTTNNTVDLSKSDSVSTLDKPSFSTIPLKNWTYVLPNDIPNGKRPVIMECFPSVKPRESRCKFVAQNYLSKSIVKGTNFCATPDPVIDGLHCWYSEGPEPKPQRGDK